MLKVNFLKFIITTLFFVGGNSSANIGDRAVLSINNFTYTQRQVEMYIVVKESLRRNASLETARVVNAGNWNEALLVFTEDMIVYQEAQRLGALQAPDQLIDKFVSLIKEKNKKSELFRATMSRLGADQAGVTRVLDMVIRISAFRRSKERQATATSTNDLPDDTGTKPAWLVELIDRVVVRRYEGALLFVEISPEIRSAPGAK